MENDEKKYEEVIKALKGLNQVKAPESFETDLQRRINSEKYSKEKKKSFWQNIFVPSRLIPSLGLIATAVVIFFVVETNSEEMDNPFLIEPRVREDVFVITEFDDLEAKQEELSKQKSFKKDEPAKKNEPVLENRRDEGKLKATNSKTNKKQEEVDKTESLVREKNEIQDQDVSAGAFSAIVESTETTLTQSPQPAPTREVTSETVTEEVITKDELNFRQVQLNAEQQKAVEELKIQTQSSETNAKSRK
jgi:hypothetical protein